MEGEGFISHSVAEPDERGVDELQERDECDQVDGDVRHQLDGHGRSIGRRLDQVTLHLQYTPFLHLEGICTSMFWCLCLGVEQFGDGQSSRGGHHRGRERNITKNASYVVQNVRSHDRARDSGETSRHDGVDLRLGHVRQERANHQRRLPHLAYEDVSRSVDRFCRRRAQTPGQESPQQFDNSLHDTQVVEDRHDRAEEYHHWQLESHLEGEIMILIFISKDKDRTGVCISQELGDAVAQPLEGMVAPGGSQDEHSENHLEGHAPKHWSPLYLQ
ncbi:hypothetical protein EGW08_006905, partial [Elysia chlorotica]